MYTYKYPHPAITADCVVFRFDNNDLKILLIERKSDPYAGCWAFPGGFMDMDETIEAAAKRELMEETCLECDGLTQFYVSSTVDRDKRERVVTGACMAFVKSGSVTAADDANKAEWFSLMNLPKLAFDHQEILDVAKTKLKEMLYFHPFIAYLLPKQFSMQTLKTLYEQILNVEIDMQSFSKKMDELGYIKKQDDNNYIFDLKAFDSFKELNLRFGF